MWSQVCKVRHCRAELCPAQGCTAAGRGGRISLYLTWCWNLLWWRLDLVSGRHAQPYTSCLEKLNSNPLSSQYRNHTHIRGTAGIGTMYLPLNKMPTSYTTVISVCTNYSLSLEHLPPGVTHYLINVKISPFLLPSVQYYYYYYCYYHYYFI